MSSPFTPADSQAQDKPAGSALAAVAHRTAIGGFVLYACFAPHSVAAADISIAIATTAWLIRIAATGRTGLRHTWFDVPILIFLVWTAASSFLSTEPEISIAKLEASWAPLAFYVCQAVIRRRIAVFLVTILILSGLAGTLYSLYDLARGRGVLIESITTNSPFHSIDVKPGDTVWRVNGHRVYAVAEIDQQLRNLSAGIPVVVSLITKGEHIERPGFVITDAAKMMPTPSGLSGEHSSHRFRASGWTRHYETFSELLQIIAQLAFGLALAHLRNHGLNSRSRLALAATALLAIGIALTAMRTVLIAFVVGAFVVVWQSVRGRARLIIIPVLLVALATGSFVVWQTRAQDALELRDPSSSLRLQVARIGLSRILIHPIFGHGMDAAHRHWNEWGFPGSDMLHLHSTPLQLAFDRGLPTLVFWLWIVGLFWLSAFRAQREASDSSDTNRYGVLLGILGAVTGFLASSLVNYNFGDAEVALLFWWILGILVALQFHKPSWQDV